MKTFTLAIRITTVVALSFLMVQCGNKQAAPNQSVSDDTTISSYRDKLPIAYINVDSVCFFPSWDWQQTRSMETNPAVIMRWKMFFIL